MTGLSAVLVALAAAALLLLAVGAATLRRRRTIVLTVSGLSMAPALRPGERVLVRRRTADDVPRRGDVVVVEEPGPCRPGDLTGAAGARWVVKRIAAVAGDREPSCLPGWARQPSGVVPPGRLVLLGDNPAASRDSRHYGTVPVTRVVGVVLRRPTI